MVDCTVGIDIRLTGMNPNPEKKWMNDFGYESTRVENLSFNNIIMDKIFSEPIKISINEHTGFCKIDEVRNLYFSNIHASSPQGIQVQGRPENIIKNVRFSDCTFTAIDYSCFKDDQFHGASYAKANHGTFPLIKYADGVVFNNVEFKSEL